MFCLYLLCSLGGKPNLYKRPMQLLKVICLTFQPGHLQVQTLIANCCNRTLIVARVQSLINGDCRYFLQYFQANTNPPPQPCDLLIFTFPLFSNA